MKLINLLYLKVAVENTVVGLMAKFESTETKYKSLVQLNRNQTINVGYMETNSFYTSRRTYETRNNSINFCGHQ